MIFILFIKALRANTFKINILVVDLETAQFTRRKIVDVDFKIIDGSARIAFKMSMVVGDNVVPGFIFFDGDDPYQLGLHKGS
jgi:hypothetical protein